MDGAPSRAEQSKQYFSGRNQLERPEVEGKAGSRRKGYNLQESIGLKDDDLAYNAFITCVHRNVDTAQISRTITYKKQDGTKIQTLCKLVNKEIPYFTKKRFPNWWPITEALKQYLRNSRKNDKKRMAERMEKRKAAKEVSSSDNDPDPDCEDVQSGAGTDIGESGTIVLVNVDIDSSSFLPRESLPSQYFTNDNFPKLIVALVTPTPLNVKNTIELNSKGESALTAGHDHPFSNNDQDVRAQQLAKGLEALQIKLRPTDPDDNNEWDDDNFLKTLSSWAVLPMSQVPSLSKALTTSAVSS
ncbi:hypothetical protein K435DRAFT_968165 [Dendrothele bispora CBS 962.96]|uniref:Uncharacterized protein n=1 Tax=Dendrothele bispora (strain CBS 962.96) TaxID=1314807 RepID=A0A4S8LQ53_DENBC|nr:hypothetical protein K435DRAFT_968165 [Dendrothele bispora CBS 962.96]